MADRAEPERMADFFDSRAQGYEAHMERSVASFDRFYAAIASPVPKTQERLSILDVGCGTGLELEAILSRAPNAVVTGIDVSARMLDKLRERYERRSEQLHLIQGSYLEVPLGESRYDYAVAVMTLHHLLPTRKLELYRRIRRALKREGGYVEGDWVVSPEEEEGYRSRYEELVLTLSRERAIEREAPDEGSYHIDVPLSLETETRLLVEAGYNTVDVIWQGERNDVYVARG